MNYAKTVEEREQWDRKFFRRSLRGAESDPACHLYSFTFTPELDSTYLKITLALSLPEPKALVIGPMLFSKRPLLRRETPITEGQAVSFLGLLERLQFWQIPAEEPETSGGYMRIVMDGENWVFEGVRDGQYHRIHRDSPAIDSRIPDANRIYALAEGFLDIGSVFHFRLR